MTASVIAVVSLGIQVSQSLVDYYTAVKGQKDDISQTIRKLETLLDVLGILSKHLVDRKFRTGDESLVKTIESNIGNCEDCIHELQREADKFKDSSLQGVRAAARTVSRRLAYPFRQSTLQKLEEDIDEIVAHLNLTLHLLQQKAIGNVQDEVEDTKALLGIVRATQISATIRDWLRAPDATINYNEAAKKRHVGTGLWFVQGETFSTWLKSPNSFLWLYGFAGCGKSVLCSTAIQHVFRYRRSHGRIGVAFFFFTFNDNSKQDASAMLRALVLQLSSQVDTDHGLLSRFHDRYRHATPPDQDLIHCLHQIIDQFSDVYIIIDALDESPLDRFRQDVLQAITDIRKWSKSGLHLLVTSRNEIDIRDEFDRITYEAVSLKNESVDRDIASYISDHLRINRRLRKWEAYFDIIQAALTERANGV
jgi:hypothetical protein